VLPAETRDAPGDDASPPPALVGRSPQPATVTLTRSRAGLSVPQPLPHPREDQHCHQYNEHWKWINHRPLRVLPFCADRRPAAMLTRVIE
jgi:hypothetical protein